MKKTKLLTALFVSSMLAVVLCGVSAVYAADNIGSVVALRGTAVIDRDSKTIEAKVKDGIQLKDTVETRVSSRTKMLFIDDSVLTMGENAKVVIKDFVYSKDKGGKSIFNLIDGKMRSVVGKSEFEVHTPTAVAAARGTVIDFVTGMTNGKPFTTITCLEGIVDIRSTDPSITGRVSLRPGMTMTIMSGQPLPSPSSAPATSGGQSARTELGEDRGPKPPTGPPIINQTAAKTTTNPTVNIGFPPVLPPPPPPTTPVNVGIGFPAPNTGGVKVGW